MKEKKDNRIKWLHVRLTAQEYQKIDKAYQQSTCRKISDYVRHALFGKPIKTTCRNQSMDDFTTEMIVLYKELNAIGNNLNQCAKKLHTLDGIAEFRPWISIFEKEKAVLDDKIREIKKYMQKMEERWLQS